MSNTQNATQNEAQKTAETPTLQDIERKQFEPDALEAGQQYVNSVIEICTNEGVEPVFNFDLEEDFPDGFGLAVVPITERVPEQGNVTRGVCIAAIPSVNTILEDDTGESYVKKLVTDSLIRQVAAAAKQQDSGITSLPFKVQDFTTTARGSGLAAFNAVASLYVKALKGKGLKFMSKVLLRQVLSSASFAEQQFPRLEQSNWEMVLNSMIAHVQKEGIEPGVLKHWLDTRDSVEVDMEGIDLSDIDEMV